MKFRFEDCLENVSLHAVKIKISFAGQTWSKSIIVQISVAAALAGESLTDAAMIKEIFPAFSTQTAHDHAWDILSNMWMKKVVKNASVKKVYP